jgi:hypothetical protein
LQSQRRHHRARAFFREEANSTQYGGEGVGFEGKG